jgi:hypothetical protein
MEARSDIARLHPRKISARQRAAENAEMFGSSTELSFRDGRRARALICATQSLQQFLFDKPLAMKSQWCGNRPFQELKFATGG